MAVNPFRRFEERYVYDIDDQVTYDTTANRLMTVERIQFDTDPGQESSTFFDPTGPVPLVIAVTSN